MIKQTLYLGWIEWVGDRRAKLQPFYQSALDLSGWKPIKNPEQDFPNTGQVIWFNPTTRDRKTPLVFYIEESPTFDPNNPYHERFRVAKTPEYATEILDLRGLGDADSIRRLVTEQGLSLSYVPSPVTYLWIDDATWVGPVRLVQEGDNEAWLLDRSQTQEPVSVHQPLQASQLMALDLSGKRLFLIPGAKVGASRGLVDWAPDELVLKRVLRSVRKHDRAYTDALGLTERMLDRAAELVNAGGLTPVQQALEEHRLKRARALLTTLSRRQGIIDALLAELLEVPTVASRVADEVATVRGEAMAQVRHELANEIARCDALKEQVAAASMELASIEEAISQRRAEQKALVDAFDLALSHRLQALMSRPELELANVAFVRAALRLEGAAPEPVQRPAVPTLTAELAPAAPSPSLPAWLEATGTNGARLEDATKLRKSLREALRARSVPSAAAIPLHAAFLAGAMPVLAGSRAYSALEAYASCVAGGRLLWLPISPGTLDPRDLLGWVDPVTRRFLPHPGRLLDLLLAARNSDDLYLVVLDGVNRAAVDAYLAPILACYADAGTVGTRRALPVVHPLAVAPNDVYAQVPFLTWPPNVLVAGIMSEGAATVPPAPPFWASAYLLHMDQFPDDGTKSTATGLGATAVSLQTWHAWKEAVTQVDSSAAEELLSSITTGGLALRRDALDLCTRFYAAARTWAEEKVAIESMVAHCLVPQMGAHQERLFFAALNDTGWNSENVETAIRLARDLLS